MEQQSTHGNPWFTVSIGLIGLIVGYSLASGMKVSSGTAQVVQAPTAAAPAAPSDQDLTPPSLEGGLVLGKADAPVTLLEFSDVQCPFCRKWVRETEDLIRKNYVETGKVKIVFRHYPLNFHPGAMPAAMAIECAAEQSQDAGWKMHDALFAEQDKKDPSGNMVSFTTDDIKTWAKSIAGLNQASFATCLDSNKYADKINQDMADGSAGGISGTPGFWVLGPDGEQRLISGAYPYSEFQAAFDEFLN